MQKKSIYFLLNCLLIWNLALPAVAEHLQSSMKEPTVQLPQLRDPLRITHQEQRQLPLTNGNTTLAGVPNAPTPDTQLSATPGKANEKNVSTWNEFEAAVVNKSITQIFVQANIYNTKNVREASIPLKNLTINGNGYYIDFRNTSLEFDSILPAATKYTLTVNSLTMYGYNYYGPISIWSKPVGNSKITAVFNNITYVGTQLIAAWDWDVQFSGTVENHSVNSYISPYNQSQQSGDQNQENLEAVNVSFTDDCHYNGTSVNTSVIYLWKEGQLTIGKNAEVNLTAGRDLSATPGAFADYAVYLNGNIVLDENAKLNITTRPTGDQYAIYFNGLYNSITTKKNAEITINGIAPSKSKALIYMQPYGKISIGDEARFNINWQNKGSGTAALINFNNNNEFIIGKKGVFNGISDGEGTQTLLYFGIASTFRFADAKMVNLQFTNAAISKNAALIKMLNISGRLDVDAQKVQAWDQTNIASNTTSKPTFEWTPMFKMVTIFSDVQATSRTGQSIYQNITDSYMKNFYPEKFSRLLYSEIESISLKVQDEVNDNPDSPYSTSITGTTAPGAYVRITGDPALPKPMINPNITGSTNTEVTGNYSLIADENGHFTIQTTSGKSFTATNTIKIFAYKNSQQAVENKIVVDKTAPLAEGRNLVIVKNDPLPSAKDFTIHATDSNPFNKEITYRFNEDYQALTSQIGTHPIVVSVADSANNTRNVVAKLQVENSIRGVLANSFSVKLSELRRQITTNQLDSFLLKQSNAYGFEIVNYEKKDLTNLVQVKDRGKIETLKKGNFDIQLEMIRSTVYTTKFTVHVEDDEAVQPTNPENPGSTPPKEQENGGTGQSGLLKLDYIPSTFEFGEVQYGFKPITIHAKKTASALQWLQVSDNRPKNQITSWSIYVSEDGPLTNPFNEVLTGSSITIPKGRRYNEMTGSTEIQSNALISNRIEIEKSPQRVFSASNTDEKMQNISTDVWDATEVQLRIPGGQEFSNTSYSNLINWTLVAEPDDLY